MLKELRQLHKNKAIMPIRKDDMFQKRAKVFDVPEKLKRVTVQMADLKDNTYQ